MIDKGKKQTDNLGVYFRKNLKPIFFYLRVAGVFYKSVSDFYF